MNGYQLLNQVGSGGTLSSLFTILSLFTENVKMSWQDGDRPDEHLDPRSRSSSAQPPLRTRSRRSDSDVSQFDLSSLPGRRPRSRSVSSSGSTVHGVDMGSPRGRSASREMRTPRIPSGGLPSSRTSTHTHTSAGPQIHYSVVARAAEDSTLAVIPAEAFQRLTKKFPKAAAHIVQGRSVESIVGTKTDCTSVHSQ